MMSNTYLPHVGGVARSVEAFAQQYRTKGHRVLIVAPEFPGEPEAEEDVVRVPAIQNFNGTDFSVRLPIPGFLGRALAEFQPDIVHSHHPFLLGDTALRVAARLNIPLVFTHHTMYERYTHYVPGDSPAMQRFVMDLSLHYANVCDQVFAPSESIAAILRKRGVEVPIEALPTGVDVDRFANGDREGARQRIGLPHRAFVVGHLGRLAPEKNLLFLAKAVIAFLKRHRDAYFLLVGTGPSENEIEQLCRRAGVHNRTRHLGLCQGQELVDAYHTMDAFAFASTSETQGMVLTEAMAAGVPVVAIDAPGVREVVVDRRNGRLLDRQDVSDFARALQWIASHQDREVLRAAARTTASDFSIGRCADRALGIYENLIAGYSAAERSPRDQLPWESTLRLFDVEYHLWSNRVAALKTSIQKGSFVRWIKHRWRELVGPIPSQNSRHDSETGHRSTEKEPAAVETR
jgi:glycosyltransferase involved in cell wall biosynthesis